MPTLLEPSTTARIAVRVGQPIYLRADAATDWFASVDGGSWTLIATGVASAMYTPSSVTHGATFDVLEIGIVDTPPASKATFHVCQGPVVGPRLTTGFAPQPVSGRGPGDEGADDDDPVMAPMLASVPAARGGLATVPSGVPGVPSAPAGLVASLSPGLSVDVSGKLAQRTAIAPVRGLGPFPTASAFYQQDLYYRYDFGKYRTLGVSRILYKETVGANEHVAIVYGDGRRATFYKASGGSYVAAVGVRSTLSTGGGYLIEATGDGLSFYYPTAAINPLDRVIDGFGNPVYYRYDVNSRLQKIEGPSSQSGLVPYFSYDGNGRAWRLVLEDPLVAGNNRTTYFSYDGNGHLSQITGPELCTTTFEYANDRLSAVTDAEGYRWEVNYDGSARVENVRDARTAYTYFGYDAPASPAVPLRTRVRDRVATTIYFEYNGFGAPTSVVRSGPEGYPAPAKADYYRYDASGNLTQSQNPAGNTWFFEYTSAGLRRVVTDPLGARTYYVYDGGRVTQETDALGRTRYYSYDAGSRLGTARDPDLQNTYLSYGTNGLLQHSRDRTGAFTYFGYDGKGNATATVDALGHASYYEYNSAGERTKATDAENHAAYFTYDKKGRTIETADSYLSKQYYAYDSRCNLVTQVDPRGTATYHEYDGNSNRTRTVQDLGATATREGARYLATYFAYDADDRSIEQKDARLKATTFSYDGLGRRATQSDPLGATQYFSYDDADQLEFQRDAEYFPTYFTYDAAGRRQTTKDAYGGVTYMGYDLKGRAVRTTDQLGFSTDTLYDALDRRLRTTGPLGFSQYYGYDAEGRTLLQIDPRQNASYFTYDAAGRQLTSLDRGRLRTYYAYDKVGNQRQVHQEQGWGNQPWGASPYGGERVTTYYTYDRLNRQETVHGPFGTTGTVNLLQYYGYDAASSRTVEKTVLDGGTPRYAYYEYDPVGAQVKRINPPATVGQPRGESVTYFDVVGSTLRSIDQEGRTQYYAYDDEGRQAVQSDALGSQWHTYYTSRGQASRRIDPMGRTTYFTYDRLGRQSFVSNALGETTYYGYDPRSSRVKTTEPRGFSMVTTYDANRRTTHIMDALGGVSCYGYDAGGNRTVGLDPLGKPAYFTYDQADRQTHAIDGLGYTTYHQYDARGSITVRQDADGRRTKMFYDAGSRLVRSEFTNDPTCYYMYDAVGSMTEARHTTTGATSFAYDDMNRVSTKTSALAGSNEYSYDKSSLRASFKDPALQENAYSRDAAGRTEVVRLVDDGAKRQYYSYDASGFPTTKSAPDDVVTTYYTYEAATTLLQQAVVRDPSGTMVSYFSYERDAGGRPLVVKRDGIAGEPSGASYYEYDALGRLTREKSLYGSVTYFHMYYGYDAASNRILVQQPEPTGYLPFTLHSYFRYDKRNALYENFKVVDSGGSLSEVTDYYSYDNTGRVQRLWTCTTLGDPTREARYFSYDDQSRVSAIYHQRQSSPDTPRYFKYDATGELTVVDNETASGPAYWAWDGSKLLTEKAANSATFAYYRHNDSVAEKRIGSGVEFKLRTAGSVKEGVPVAAPDGGTTLRTRKPSNPTQDEDPPQEFDSFGVKFFVASTPQSDKRLWFKPDLFAALSTSKQLMVTKSGRVWVPENGKGLELRNGGVGNVDPIADLAERQRASKSFQLKQERRSRRRPLTRDLRNAYPAAPPGVSLDEDGNVSEGKFTVFPKPHYAGTLGCLEPKWVETVTLEGSFCFSGNMARVSYVIYECEDGRLYAEIEVTYLGKPCKEESDWEAITASAPRLSALPGVPAGISPNRTRSPCGGKVLPFTSGWRCLEGKWVYAVLSLVVCPDKTKHAVIEITKTSGIDCSNSMTIEELEKKILGSD